MTEKVESEAAPPPVTEEVPAGGEQQPKQEEERKEVETVKEKKPRTPRERKPRQQKAASHPPYFQMIKEAILALNEKSGSSPYAIAKYMEDKHKSELPMNFRKILALQIKNSVSRGKLIKIRASYKLSEAGKKETNGNGVKPTTIKTRSASEAEANKKPKEANAKAGKRARMTAEVSAAANKKKQQQQGVKKAKKSTAGAKPKPKLKQPKSIRSPKRMKKVAAV